MLCVSGERGLSRRSFVQAGILGVGGLALPDLLRLRAEAKTGTNDTAVILFWMSGGPGHMETWDPKPNAVSQYRGPFGTIPTNVPGIQFGELMPRQAKIADKLAILRSVAHGSGDHTKGNHWMLTGFEGPAFNVPDFRVQRRPSLGSAASKLRGANRPGMPAYAAVPHLRGGTDNFFHYSAYLGPAHNPFVVDSDPNKPEFRVRNLSLSSGLTFDRLDDRREVLGLIDRVKHAGNDARDSSAEQAFSLLTSREVAKAFDINAESDAVRDRYGRHIFGQSALLARRLVEAGVTFVTVNTEPWDHHATAGRLPTAEGGKKLIPPFDAAFASLVEDLHQRGLNKKVLVVAMGEFGRTPRMNPEGGRDHWGNVFSVAFAGGEIKTGITVGKSNPRGEYPIDRPLTPQDVTATVFHHLGIDAPKVSFPDQTGRPIYLVEHGEAVRELVG
ncbi:MAG: DUF1501 domain-containing protein [Gemmataceae bacterium]|nr:DUF1501 domain-containing protein [Gemmataceae bacterium]